MADGCTEKRPCRKNSWVFSAGPPPVAVQHPAACQVRSDAGTAFCLESGERLDRYRETTMPARLGHSFGRAGRFLPAPGAVAPLRVKATTNRSRKFGAVADRRQDQRARTRRAK